MSRPIEAGDLVTYSGPSTMHPHREQQGRVIWVDASGGCTVRWTDRARTLVPSRHLTRIEAPS